MTRRRNSEKEQESAGEEVAVSDADSSDWEIDIPEAPKQRQHHVRVIEKDAEEAELERLVLGDKAGFRAQLFQPDTIDDAENYMKDLSLAVVPDGDDEDTGLAELDDSNMFFTDDAPLPGTGPNATAGSAPTGKKDATDEDGEDVPAWEDSDDERLRVSLTKHSQLHRLRRFMGEDIVSGADYCKRLREQYLRLNPQPDWATEARKAQKRRDARALSRRRRRSGSGSDVSSSSESDDDGLVDSDVLPLDKFFRSAGSLAAAGNQQPSKSRKRRKLKPEVLNIMKTRDIQTRHAGPVTSLAFHPQYAVLLSSSAASTLHIHQVAPGALPTPNPLLTAVRVTGMPVHRAVFVDPAGTQVAFAGPRRFLHTWDLNSGQVQRISRMQGHRLEQRSMDRFRVSPDGLHMAMIASEQKGGGAINVMSVQTMQWVAHARLDSPGGLIDFQWWRDSAGFSMLGRDGRIGEWRLDTRRFVGIWRDEGAVGGKAIALGGRGGPDALGGDRWVAVGSGSGIVNVYERQELVEATAKTTESKSNSEDSTTPLVTIKAQPKPRRCFEQLTTPATHLVFSPDGQLLAFASQYKGDALRLAHLPSCTVYRNWPTQQTGLGQITAVAFSAESDMLAVANARGRTRLWEIRG